MAVALSTLPESLRGRVGPDAPGPVRMLIARALVPMGPEDLFTALSYLASNETGELAETARTSLADVPISVVNGVIRSSDAGDLLDFAVREYVSDDNLVQGLLLNTSLPDDSLIWAARNVKSRHIELIGNNQERISRLPKLVEAIYYNPEAPMAVVTRVFETAVRAGLRLNHIPGYREIYQSIFGREAAVDEERPSEQPVEEVAVEVADASVEAVVYEEVLDDENFTQALIDAAKEEEEGGDKEEGGALRKSMHALIEEMSVPQRVRMALVGNAAARNILIKDGKQIVARSVLTNPQVTQKEIAMWAKNKAIPEVIIQQICRNREWTRNPTVQLALIQHPKTPSVAINRWIRSLNKKLLKQLSKSRDVPAYVSRLAKNILTQRDEKK